MEWLFKPKVQLGLLVNFAFVMFTLVSSLAGSPTPERWHPAATYDAPAIPYAPLPPPATLSIATVTESGGLLNVSLNNDLTLVKKTGRTLLLSPSFTMSGRAAGQPSAVTLRFTIF